MQNDARRAKGDQNSSAGELKKRLNLKKKNSLMAKQYKSYGANMK